MNQRARKIATITFVLCVLPMLAQGQAASQQNTPPQNAPPSTDIFLVDLENRNGRLSAGNPVNIIRREGYDNQPYFLPDGASLLFTSIREGTLPDIYHYTLADKSITQMTRTPEGEYSPTPAGKFFSVIRVEADQTQRLWKFPFDGGAPSLVLENIKPVGYHCWLDENTLALFVLGRPATLQIADTRTGKAEVMESNIGRSLHRHPLRGTLTFVHKLSETEWTIKEMDIKTRKVETITKTLAGSEDFTWTKDGMILMASGAKLYKFDPAKDKDWQQVADFASAGIKNITRLAVSPRGDKLALVASLETAK